MNIMPGRDEFQPHAPIAEGPDMAPAERAIIAAMMTNPNNIEAITEKVTFSDFEDPLLRRVFDILSGLHKEGRKPSMTSVLAVTGNDEVAPRLTVKDVLSSIIRDAMTGMFLPFQDAVEVMHDMAMRRQLSAIGSTLQSGGYSQGESVSDLVAEAVAGLDDVTSSLRVGKRKVYDVAEAGQIALDHYASTARKYPTTGLVDLDRMSGGWPLGQLSIVAGRPGMGKSAAASGFVRSAARAGHATAFFSLEMQGEQLGARLLCDLAYVRSDPIFYEDILNRREIDGRKKQRLAEAHETLRSLPAVIEEQRGLSIAEICSRTRKIAHNFDREGRKLETVFVDHIGLVRPSQRYAGNRTREVAEITDGLATLAKEMDIAVVGLCQLNRGVEGRENKRPSLSDLRDSGAIEEDASLVMFAYRPAYYLENTRFDDQQQEQFRLDQLELVRNRLEFIVSKNRNGRIGTVDVFCEIGANAIRNASFGG